MADKSNKNAIYTDPTLFGVTNGTLTGRSYSEKYRPKWVLDLTESFHPKNDPNFDPFDPNLISFPQIDTQSTEKQIHPLFKIPMSYSTEVTSNYSPTAKIRYKPLKAQKLSLAMLFSYRGTGYQGLQIQFVHDKRLHGSKTIEGDILDAFISAKYIGSHNADVPHKVHWGRAARTDKGVHAATNLLTAKLLILHANSIPEAGYVRKKALRYASSRSIAIIPIIQRLIDELIKKENIEVLENIEPENCSKIETPLDTNSPNDTGAPSEEKSSETMADTPTTTIVPAPMDSTEDDIQPLVLLTTLRSELPGLIDTNIAVNIVGDITISPNFIHTLKKFKIIPEDGVTTATTTTTTTTTTTATAAPAPAPAPATASYPKIIQNLINQANTEANTISPSHIFTQWEHKLLHLVAEFGSEWENVNNNDDGEDNNNESENKPKFEDPNDPLKLPPAAQHELLLKNGVSAEEIPKLSRRQRDAMLMMNYVDPHFAARRKNQSKIPYFRQQGWNDESLAHLTNPDYLSDCLQIHLRQFLPSQFHLVRAVKVTGSFDPKIQASSRTYEYIIPSFAFMPIREYPEGVFEKMVNIASNKAFQSQMDKDMAAVLNGQELQGGDGEDDDDDGNQGDNGGKKKGKKNWKDQKNNEKGGNNGQNDRNSEQQQELNKNGKRTQPGGGFIDGVDTSEIESTNTPQTTLESTEQTNNTTSMNDSDSNTTTTTTTTSENNQNSEISENKHTKTTKKQFENLTPPQELLDYKLSPQSLTDIQFALSHFLGTRSHHNFTSGKKPTDPAAKRFIRSFKPIGTFMVGNVEFVHMCVHGDSFLLHQIRKMVGFTMSLIRGNYNDIPMDCKKPCIVEQRFLEPYNAAIAANATTATGTDMTADISTDVNDNNNVSQDAAKSEHQSSNQVTQTPTLSSSLTPSPHIANLCPQAFGHVFSTSERYNIPPAPALGLLLDHVHYDTHDLRIGNSIPNIVSASRWSHIRETLYASYQRTVPFIMAIKQREIYPEIAIQEMSMSNAWKWLHLLNLLDFDAAKLDINGIPLKKSRINMNVIKVPRRKGGLVDVHGHVNNGNNNDITEGIGGIQYVQLDTTSTANVPTFATSSQPPLPQEPHLEPQQTQQPQ